jgi:hypothetical protein
VVLCVVILIGWIASGWWQAWATYAHPAQADGMARVKSVSIGHGSISFVDWLLQPSFRGWYCGTGRITQFDPRTILHRWDLVPKVDFRAGATVVIPFWIPFLLMALPTGLLFYRDRRVRGRCPNCRYDLFGNTTRVCPECEHTVANNQA